MNNQEIFVLEAVACDLCGAQDTDVLLTTHDQRHPIPGEFSLVRCRNCGLVYINPRPNPATIDHAYPDTYFPFQATNETVIPASWRTRLRQHVVDAHIFHRPTSELEKLALFPLYFGMTVVFPGGMHFPTPQPGAKVLDIGCGTGKLLYQMIHQGWQVYGVEPSPVAAEQARQRLGPEATIVEGTLETGMFEPGSFDAIAMAHVIEHLHSPSKILKLIKTLLKPDGWLVAVLPNFGGLEYRQFGQAWLHLEIPRHLYQFTPSTLSALLKKEGYQSIQIVHAADPITFNLSAKIAIQNGTKIAYQGSTSGTLIPWWNALRAAWTRQSSIITVYAQNHA